MFKFILNRLLQAIPVLFIIVAMTFFMVRAAPGGPFSQERKVSQQILEKMNEHYGLNDPVYVQFFNYLKHALQGDLGYSYKHEGRTVNEMIAESFPVSLKLGALSLLFAVGVGIPAGVLGAVKKNTFWDYSAMSVALMGICLPTFVVGPLISLIFGLWLGWFNVSGWFESGDVVLPSITLGLAYAAYIARLTRGGMLDVLNQDYIRTARAKGLSPSAIVWKHALKGGLLPVVSFMGPALAGLISGSFVVETIFQIPGLGRHFVNAALSRDYTMVLGTVLFYAVMIIIANLVVDILQVVLNPRLKYE
ncbi:MAG: ABC transporter permease [Opitutales bacterium]|nr:ABC transporter permease [Opitutales bacterium]